MSEPSSTTSDGHKCPACRIDLLMSERQGIEIDYCPNCRGVWLDRGELDKIIERSCREIATAAAASPVASFLPPGAPGSWIQPPRQQPHDALQHRQEHGERRDRHDDGEHRRGGGFLSNLFD